MNVQELKSIIEDFPDDWNIRVRIGEIGFDLSPLNIGLGEKQMRLIFVKNEE